MRKNIFLTIGYLALCVSLVSSCMGANDQDVESYLRDIVLLNNAKNIYTEKHNDTIQLSFQLLEEYPAKSVINKLSSNLSENGWSPLKEDYLNPGILSSHSKGWSEFEDWSSTPKQIIRQWIGDWEDAAKNIIRMALIYRKPLDQEGQELDKLPLQIHIIYTSPVKGSEPLTRNNHQ